MLKVPDSISNMIHDGDHDDGDDNIVDGSLSSSSSNLHSSRTAFLFQHLLNISSHSLRLSCFVINQISSHDNTQVNNTKIIFLLKAIFEEMPEIKSKNDSLISSFNNEVTMMVM